MTKTGASNFLPKYDADVATARAEEFWGEEEFQCSGVGAALDHYVTLLQTDLIFIEDCPNLAF